MKQEKYQESSSSFINTIKLSNLEISYFENIYACLATNTFNHQIKRESLGD